MNSDSCLPVVESFLAEIRAWPKFQAAVARDPEGGNGKLKTLELWFAEGKTRAAHEPAIAAVHDAAVAIAQNTDRPIGERVSQILDFLIHEKAALGQARSAH